MKWEEGGGLDKRLIADDGEILDRIEYNYHKSGYMVVSTGKTYVSQEQAKKAAERAHEHGNLR